MKPPAFLGRVVYFFGYPIFRLLIRDTTRAYVAVVFDEKILLTKNWLGFQKKWRLPGGGVHVGEDAATAAVRELGEELGIAVIEAKLQPLSQGPLRARFGYDYHLFVYNVDGSDQITIDEREILAAEYIPKNQLSSQVLGEETAQAITLLGWFA